MSIDKTPGVISWMDLCVDDADRVRDFYMDVVGWKTMDISMGDYNDYCMLSPSDGQVRSGICHNRGSNAGIPNAWMLYINVMDLDARMERVKALGGEVIYGPRKMGEKAQYCIIRDPGGAVCALYDHGEG
jgi:predicted enzyme related to lactoylglutathione lyase